MAETEHIEVVLLDGQSETEHIEVVLLDWQSETEHIEVWSYWTKGLYHHLLDYF